MKITIASRFCGPDNSGNGGYTCGVLAQALGGEAEVTLRAPPPLETPLDVQVEGDKARMTQGEQVVAEGTRTHVDLEVPLPPSWDEALAAQRRFPGFTVHAFPRCFTCGTARTPGDGLCIHTGEVQGRDIFAATWIPDSTLADAQGTVRPEFFWAATDCAGAWATNSRQQNPSVLGRFAARLDRPIAAGERYIVIGWPIGHEGRKHHAGTALFTADGERVGFGRQTWVELKR
jgi:hypothetical protein